MPDEIVLRRFKNLMQGYIEQLKAMPPSGILQLDAGLEAQINELARQLGWQEPFKRDDNGPWFGITSASGGYCGGTQVFAPPADKKPKRGKSRPDRISLDEVEAWHKYMVGSMVPELLSWVTKAEDALIAAGTPPVVADTEPATQGGKLSEPSREALAAYRACKVMGRKQADAAPELGTNQGQISRWCSEVSEWVAAGNILPNLPDLPAKARPVDPEIIEMGEREDGRTPRQRQRGNVEDDAD